MERIIAEQQNIENASSALWRGITKALPIVSGYIPVGFAYGVLSQKAGISQLNAILMPILLYAGAGQFIAVGLIAKHTSMFSIIFTIFIVNLRHLMMASALAPYLSRWRKRELAAFGFEMTDEAFAVHSTNFPKGVPSKTEVFATNVTAHASWILGGVLGVIAGRLIKDVKPYGLDYALIALFIALVVLQVTNRIQFFVAIFTGTLSVVLLQAGVARWNVIFATLIGATLGAVIEQWNKQRSS